MTSKTITGIVTWLKGWFYTKDEITTKENALQAQINNKASQSDLNTLSSTVSGKLDASDYVVDSALSSSSTNPVQNKVINTALSSKASQSDLNTLSSNLNNKLDASDYVVDDFLDSDSINPVQNKVINTALSNKAPSIHNHSTSQVRNISALPHIGISANVTQSDINSAIDTAIGNLTGAEIIKVVTTLPTASASTQNALYLLSNDNQYDIYITIEDNGSYSWEKLDDDVLSDLSIDWSDIENKPSTFTPSSHTHGNINNNGTISTTIATSSIANFSTLNFPLVRDSTDSAKIKIGLVPTDMVRGSTAYSNIGSSANATQNTINGLIDTAIGGTATKSEVIDWDTLTFVAKADDESGAITFDYLE